jgi:hypothetical protein
MSENDKMNPKIRQLQFIPSAVGRGVAGKKQKMNPTDKNSNAIPLTTTPAPPRLKRDAKRASPRRRFAKMQPMTTRYEEMSPTSPRDVITLKAMVEPMMMRDISVVQSNDTRIALTGTSQPGRTC